MIHHDHVVLPAGPVTLRVTSHTKLNSELGSGSGWGSHSQCPSQSESVSQSRLPGFVSRLRWERSHVGHRDVPPVGRVTLTHSAVRRRGHVGPGLLGPSSGPATKD
eukprot:2617788-Rhodomonas_salina.1